jgi:hypothetical protein
VFGCTCQSESDYYGIVSGLGFGCTPEGAQDWWKSHGCNTSPKEGGNCQGPACKLQHSAPCTPCPPGSDQKKCPPLPPSPPPPPPPPTPSTGFAQTLHLANATTTIVTPHLTVSVWFELNAASMHAAILHVTATTAGTNAAPDSSGGFGLKVALEPYRVEGKPSGLGAGLCFPAIEHADKMSTSTKDAIVWYHYNEPNNTNYYTSTVANQGVDPATPGLADTFSGKAWGGSVAAEGLSSGTDTSGLTLTGAGLSSVDVKVRCL